MNVCQIAVLMHQFSDGKIHQIHVFITFHIENAYLKYTLDLGHIYLTKIDKISSKLKEIQLIGRLFSLIYEKKSLIYEIKMFEFMT